MATAGASARDPLSSVAAVGGDHAATAAPAGWTTFPAAMGAAAAGPSCREKTARSKPAAVPVLVPNLKGRTIRDAKFALEREGLKLGGIEYRPSDDFPASTIMEQEVAAGQQVKRDRYVAVVVSQGTDERKPLFSMFIVPGRDKQEWLWIGWSPLSTLGPTDSSRNRPGAITSSLARGNLSYWCAATWNVIGYSLEPDLPSKIRIGPA